MAEEAEAEEEEESGLKLPSPDLVLRWANMYSDAAAFAMLREAQRIAQVMTGGPLSDEAEAQLADYAKRYRAGLFDAYMTGAAEMLKLTNGSEEREPWADEWNHEKRIRELIGRYAEKKA